MDEPVAVLHVVDCLNVGGTERQLFELVRRLDRRRWRPLVACFKAHGELLPSLRALGVEPMEFPLGGSLTRPGTAWQVARMAWYAHRQGVKLIHTHDFYSNVVGVAAAQLAGVRAIASRRDLAHWLSPVQRRALRLALKLSDCVIANARAVGELVLASEFVRADKLRVVPNGIDVAAFDERARPEPDPALPSSRNAGGKLPQVAMIAAMHLPDKGHADLLEAAAQLAARGLEADWLILSDGVLRAALEERARSLGLAERVHFLGRRADIPAVLARVDLVVHPSWAEGFPNVVLEAMCAARPVVATRVGGCPELLIDGENGFLVEPRRPDELARAIERVLGDPDRGRALGRRGRARVERDYSLDRMTETMDNIYSSLTAAA
ncbi:MAG TPA: glycosyltransferase [Polyangia bacterium]|nr:glycosyltransferase [Polyangia bacterium]